MTMTALKRLVGRTAGAAVPSLLAEVNGGDLLSGGAHRQRLKRWLAKDQIFRLNDRGAEGEIEHMLTRRWTDGNIWENYYDIHADRFEALFSGAHGVVLEWLDTVIAARAVKQVVEVGCGDGRALTRIRARVPTDVRLTGVDINAAIIARNKVQYSDLDVAFVAADASVWLDDNCGPGTILLTIGGVMEYIAPSTLSHWFTTLAQVPDSGVILVEPVDPGHDMDATPESLIHGMEDSMSHNFPALLRGAGLEVERQEDVMIDGVRWLMILATVPGGDG